MDFRKTDHWVYDNLSEGFVFCIQRLDELFFDYTIDSYKPRALNSPSLCFELLNVINEVENGNIDKNNIKYIIEELRLAVQEDTVAKSLINTNIDYFLSYNETTSLSELSLRISVLERSLERYRYIDRLKKCLYDAVKQNSKDKINSLLGNFVTTYINWGISKKFLYQHFNKFFFNKSVEIDSEENLKLFFDKIFPKSHNYSVYFSVSKNIRLLQDSFKFFKIKIVEEIDAKLKAYLDKHNFKPNKGHIIVHLSKIMVPDPFVARDIAENRLKTLRNTSQLFFHASHLKWKRSAIVIQTCCENESLIASNQINPMKKSRNYKSNEVSKNTNKIFNNIALNGESFEKFNRIMELHSICLINSTPENQIVNLWTIIETLIPSSKNKSRVQCICDAIIPILLLKYMNKLILNLFNDFNRWNKTKTSDYINEIESLSDNQLEKFSLLLACDQYEEKRQEIYKEFENFALLRNRTYKISSILNSTKKLMNHIERHRLNVTWQIRRIYRTRNMIVHSGKTPKYINILVENTHDYIDQVISEVIEMTTSNYRINNLEQAFEFGKILNSELEKQVKKSTKPEDYIPYLISEIKI